MKAFRNSCKRSLATTLIWGGIGLTAVSHSFGGGGASGLDRSIRTPLHIYGSVVCTDCSLEGARRAQSPEHDFYQFSHESGQLIFKVASVDNKATLDSLAWPPRLWVRASDETLRKLSAEENVFKPMGITGVLSSTRTLDIAEVAVSR